MDFTTYQHLIEHNKHKTEDSISARFYDRAVKTPHTDAKGFPIFKNVCYCEIRIKDNTTEIYDQPASSDKIKRFPLEYARYQQSKKQIENGTPLEMFAFLTSAEIESCKFRGIFTVEQLAELEDDKIKKLNLDNEAKQARRFIKNTQNAVNADDWSKSEQYYKQKIASLESQIINLKRRDNRRQRR